MDQFVKTEAFNKKVAELVLTGSDTAPLDTIIVKAYKAGPDPTPGMSLGDFTICDFTGYADDTVTVNPPHIEQDGTWTLTAQLAAFLCSGTTTLNTVVGVLAVNSHDTVQFIGAAKMGASVPITGPGSGFSTVLTINSGAESTSDGSTVIV